jgi:hypothetical protein
MLLSSNTTFKYYFFFIVLLLKIYFKGLKRLHNHQYNNAYKYMYNSKSSLHLYHYYFLKAGIVSV